MLFLSSCKKYPDGPLLSLRTRTHRLVGTWEVESYIVYGIDSTGYLKSSSFYGTYQIEPEENGIGIFVSPYGGEDVTWESRRLKEKELWLKTIYNGKEYFVKFKQ